MPLATFIAGAYTATLNSVALGLTDEGFKLSWSPKNDTIDNSDQYGGMLLDLIYRGTDWSLQTEFMEANSAGPLAAAYPWGSMGVQGVIGRLGSNVATALVLTATAGTPAAAAPATLTASKAILAPGSEPELTYTSRLRTIPMKFALLPVSDTGIKNFVLG